MGWRKEREEKEQGKEGNGGAGTCMPVSLPCDRLFHCPYSRISLAPLPPYSLPSLFSLNRRACKRYATQLFLGARPPAGGPFEFMTFKEFDEQVNRTRVLLNEAGIGKGDKVGKGGREGGKEERRSGMELRLR